MGYYNSFVIRVWTGGQGRLRGTIEHVSSRASQVFVDPAVVLEFICTYLGPPPSDDGEPTRRDPTAEGEPGDDSPNR